MIIGFLMGNVPGAAATNEIFWNWGDLSGAYQVEMATVGKPGMLEGIQEK